MPIRVHSSSAPTAVSFSPAPPSSRIFTRPSVHLIHTSLHNAPGQNGQRKWREENLSLVTLQADYGAEQVSQALPRGHRTRPPRSHQRLSHVKVARGVRWGPRGSCPRPLQRCADWARKTLDPVLPFELRRAVARGQQCATALTQPLQVEESVPLGQRLVLPGGLIEHWPVHEGGLLCLSAGLNATETFSFRLWRIPRTEATQKKKE